jgi:hypothetical protein
LFVLTLIAAVVIVPLRTGTKAAGKKKGLFQRTESHEPGIENYDIRSDKAAWEKLGQFRQSLGKSASAVADVRDNFVRGEEELKQRIPNARVEYNSDIRTPEVITPDVWKAKVEWLTPASGAKRSEILRSFVKQYSSLTGVTDEQADALKVTADYTNPDGNLSYAHLEQFINGIPVFRGEVKAGFTKDGQLIRVINNLAPGLDYNSLSTEFGDPAAAVKAAAGYINYELKASDFARNNAASNDIKAVFGEGDWATTAEKMYFPTEPGVAVPAWRVMIVQPVSAYYVIVDASTGAMLWRKNLVEDQTQSATYNVYRNSNSYLDVADSPAPLSPGPISPLLGTQGVNGTRSNVTLIGNEAPNTFNNLGWITDGSNVTDGNNLEAGVDRTSPDGVDATQTGSPNRTFTSTWNPPPGNPAPGDDPLTTQAQRGAVIQMFYVMNRYHDELYKRGFTEQARNFQNDNFGRGGNGADRVSAEGQDSSGTDNANFFTAADGQRGRMQMYLWAGPTPDYDGTADAEVIIHEVTHGTSNRLHGNASGLSTNMSRGMGEGWGDFFAYTMLAEPTDPINGIYTTGGYATYLIDIGFTANYYYGIRRFPRAPITFLGPNGKPHNPFTFQYINSNCNTLIGTTSSGPNSAFPRGPVGSSTCDQVHNIGEIWSSMLWEVRNRMVSRLGFATGTTRVLQVVTDGMKLAPIGPTILQERDAIIAAATAISTADANDVRDGFRARGAGYSASVQNAGTGSNNTAVTEAFDVPNAVITTTTITDPAPGGDNDGYPEPGETVRVNVTVANNTGGPVNNVVVTATGGGNNSANFGNLADGQTVTMPISYAIPAGTACGGSISTNLTLTSSIGTQTAVTKSFTVGTPSIGVVQNFDGVTAPALPSGWVQNQTTGTGITWVTSTAAADSAPNAAFANDPAAANAAAIESPVFPVNSTSAALSFRINYNTETGSGTTGYDGAVLDIKIGAGAWQDLVTAGGAFTANGYNKTISTSFSSPIAGRQAWSGNSGGYLSATATLPASANGQNVQLRWLMASDSSVGATGVYVDNVQVVNSYTCTSAPTSRAPFDFDGDGKTDIGIFRPGASAEWWIQRSSSSSVLAAQFGTTGDQPVPADYTGDGKSDIAFFRPSNSTWYILRSEDFSFYGFQFGASTDVPAPADYDGDSKADPAVFRSGAWYILRSSDNGVTTASFGVAGDKPVAADYDGDGKADIGIFRPNGGTGGEWWIQRSTAGLLAATFGTSTDRTVVGDYTGDGKADCAFFRPSNNTWYVLRSEDLSFFGFPFGISADAPAPGDYDGDGKTDAAVFRSSGAAWYVNKSTGGVTSVNFGSAGDQPVPGSYVR